MQYQYNLGHLWKKSKTDNFYFGVLEKGTPVFGALVKHNWVTQKKKLGALMHWAFGFGAKQHVTRQYQ